ncbi:hypothetical protein XENOCAPTIV_026997 [Xenoophorus captivus]|uniref:Uncharacterized protein n=1 Tax=Xenoophorus captivus TaxID=1517983 RepID=A0ABV0RFI0_9TELE
MHSLAGLRVQMDGPLLAPTDQVTLEGTFKGQCFHTKRLERFVPYQSPVSGADRYGMNPSRTLKWTREPYPRIVTTASLSTVYPDSGVVHSVNACWASEPNTGREDIT